MPGAGTHLGALGTDKSGTQGELAQALSWGSSSRLGTPEPAAGAALRGRVPLLFALQAGDLHRPLQPVQAGCGASWEKLALPPAPELPSDRGL